MATIGTFTAQGDGYTGSIKTLTLNVKQAVLRPNEKTDDKAPDFRIFAGQTEFGAAFLCADLGLALEPREDHAAYIASWLQVLKNDTRFIVSAAAHAQKAIDYLRSLQ